VLAKQFAFDGEGFGVPWERLRVGALHTEIAKFSRKKREVKHSEGLADV
jgi:hypothetical protein